MQDTEKDVRVYELGYWLVPTIPEDGVDAQVTELKNKLKNFGAGEIIAEENPYLREIAYEMCKVISNQNNYFTEGYFGWIKLELDPARVQELTRDLEVDPTIIRSMLIGTVRENTTYTKRPTTFKRDEPLVEDEVIVEEAPVAAPIAEEVTPVVEEVKAEQA